MIGHVGLVRRGKWWGCLFPPADRTVPGSHLHPQGLTGCLALQKLAINTEWVREGWLDGGEPHLRNPEEDSQGP